MGAIVNSIAYEGGRRVGEVDIDRAAEMVQREGTVVWIGLHEPDEELLRRVQAQFGLHDLAVEDAHRAHQRPKLEVYGDSLFTVLRTAQLIDGKLECGETHIFIGKGYVVTVRHGASLPYTPVRKRCEGSPDFLTHGEDFILYALMDFVVDNYFPIVEGMEERVEQIEEAIFSDSPDVSHVQRIYTIRRDLLTMRRAVVPVTEICNRLMRAGLPMIDEATHDYFRDVRDHTLILAEHVETLREMVDAALEADLMLSSARQNEVTKQLASWAAILAVPTAVAGIYGMNFEFMPELQWRYGYLFTIAMIVATCSFLYWRFKKSGWL